MNKNLKVAYLVLLIFFSYNLYSQIGPKLWESLYKDAVTIREKKDLIEKIQTLATQDFNELILIMLQDIYEFPESKMTLENYYHEQAVYFLCLMINKFEMKGTDPEILRKLYVRMHEPIYKGEVLNAIGMIGDKNTLPWMNDVLKKMNMDHRNGNFKEQEETLYGLIKGLGLYNDPSSFHELFYVAIPNYSQKIRELAQKTLKNITDNPAPLCASIINNETDYKIMLEALKYAVESKSSENEKINICKMVLYKTMDEVETKGDVESITYQNKLRDDAAYNLGELKASDSETIDLLNRKWDYDTDMNSKNITIATLQKINTEQSIETLENIKKKDNIRFE